MSYKNLYYYCKLSTAIEKILPQMSLRISPLENTNDPRENKDLVFSTISNINDNNLKIDNTFVNKLIKEDCKVLCFSLSSGKYTAGYSYSAMWAHYAENHTGICLEIDKDIFIEENKNIIQTDFFQKICYFDYETEKIIHPTVDYTKINDNADYIKKEFRFDNAKHIYFTKSKEWENENEFRLIHLSEEKNDEFCKIEKSLKNIYLGIKFNDFYLPSIKNLLFEPDVKIIKMKYKDVKLLPDYS